MCTDLWLLSFMCLSRIAIRREHFYYRLIGLLTQIYVAAILVLVSEPEGQLFALGVSSYMQAVTVSWLSPWERPRDNARTALVDMLVVVHALLQLAIQANGARSAFFIVLIIAAGGLCVLLVYRHDVVAALKRRLALKFSKNAVWPSAVTSDSNTSSSNSARPYSSDHDVVAQAVSSGAVPAQP